MKYKLFLLLCAYLAPVIALGNLTQVEQWDVFEVSVKTNTRTATKSYHGIFIHGRDSFTIKGFQDADNLYKIRFMPDRQGDWQYTIVNANQKFVKKGSFTCTPPTGNNQGPVKVVDTFYFAYANGAIYHPLGTTIYRWLEQDKPTREQTLASLKSSPFNKARMKILGPTIGGRHTGVFPFAKHHDGEIDFSSIQPRYFQYIDTAIRQLMELNKQADLIFLHPYDLNTLDLDRMTMPEIFSYLDYIIARYSAYRNVWWTTNEFDLMTHKSMSDWDEIFKYLQENDPYNRLRSHHNAAVFYDHTKPWISHASVQGESWWTALPYREKYLKPIIYDEFCYEGDGENRTVALNGDVITHRFWLMTVNGVFASHGEAFRHPGTNLMFFSQGGKLIGTSHEQLATLEKVIRESPGHICPMGHDWRLRDIMAGVNDEYLIYYLGEYQNKSWVLEELQPGVHYQAQLIDTRSGTTTQLPGQVTKNSRVELPGTPYMALILKKTRTE